MDVDLQLVGSPLGLDLRDTGVGEPLLQIGAQRQILVQQLRVVAVGEPARLPRLVEPEPEPYGWTFLTRFLLIPNPNRYFFFGAADFFAGVARFRAGAFASPAGAALFAFAPPAFALPRFGEAGHRTTMTFGRSATCTVRCAVRFTTRNARPWVQGECASSTGPGLHSTPPRTDDRRRRRTLLSAAHWPPRAEQFAMSLLMPCGYTTGSRARDSHASANEVHHKPAFCAEVRTYRAVACASIAMTNFPPYRHRRRQPVRPQTPAPPFRSSLCAP